MSETLFVVYLHQHIDDYKRADSFANVLKIFRSKDKACEYCVKLLEKDFDKEKLFEYMEEDDDFDEKDEDDLDEDIKEHKIFLDKTNNFITRYEIVSNNFSKFFGDFEGYGEFTMLPSHTMYYIKELEISTEV